MSWQWLKIKDKQTTNSTHSRKNLRRTLTKLRVVSVVFNVFDPKKDKQEKRVFIYEKCHET